MELETIMQGINWGQHDDNPMMCHELREVIFAFLLKIKQNMIDVEWKATIEANLDSLVARMAKVDSINEIKVMLQQKQHSLL
jgi:hypothetical protein